MAIKLQTKQAAPSVFATLNLISKGEGASVVLRTEEVNEATEVSGKTEWVTSKLYLKQFCTFIGDDGEPVTLDGKVLESDCVEISAAHRVVAQIKIGNELKGAFAAGRVSKAYTALELVRVVEVWDTPKNCLWRASNGITAAVGKEFDPSTGKVS